MTELKTLKDLENLVPLGKNTMRVSSYDLKQEAIKHYILCEKCNNLKSCQRCRVRMIFIKNFFNITEEDLR